MSDCSTDTDQKKVDNSAADFKSEEAFGYVGV